VNSIFDTLFARIMPEKKNSAFFVEALEVPGMSEQVSIMLERIENSPDAHDWWTDKELMRYFDTLYKAGVITLPKDVIERIRWVALLAIASAREAGFSYGNVLIPPDYLPDDEIERYEDIYGWDVVERIVTFRIELRKRGWDSLL